MSICDSDLVASYLRFDDQRLLSPRMRRGRPLLMRRLISITLLLNVQLSTDLAALCAWEHHRVASSGVLPDARKASLHDVFRRPETPFAGSSFLILR
jgi:hypothetical protein